ncbi:ATP-dependent DNA helicase MER3 homolog isoform X2 [Phalaenopsis equestris]|uniref:ATP-dependent DNA helicase MER3 homolog isoform X2 n=1 Tax=Phalaenopsis equestris TaxID=78828 RepID=UPI0009E5FCE8|nr:ATP-dependent DNA helicase MER3 homolog isoform X2 [Phalaenopsis equestris]
MRLSMDSFALRSASELPAPFRSMFSFRYFNSLQSECFSGCFLFNISMVVSAPTGSGKTVLFELCILRLFSRFLSQEGKFNHEKGVLKTIYMAPSKALVQEKLRNWNLKLSTLGITCLELTGDNESYNTKNIHEADIILTTPEKFDAVTRHGVRDGGLSFFSDISLVLIDEVHLLNDPRGAALEAVVSRIKMLSRSKEMASSPLANVRFVAVSATIPNIEDLAEWLQVPSEGIKRFGEEMRPVKLVTKVFGYAPAKNDFLFEKRLQNFVFDILMQHSRGKSALIFCSTRKGAQEAAQQLSQVVSSLGHSNPFIRSKEQQEKLKEASVSCGDKQMQFCILNGVGFHNGGLCLKDRNLIEGLFLKGDLQVLCTTNTLAHGVNLPAHTVVIKSTQYFNKEKGLYLEYDRSMVLQDLQMCGRAGRPPFDDTGVVIIMTRRATVHLYENLLNGCEMVESQLLPCVMEHLTAEIVQLTVADISLAIEWLKCSYLYVRIKKNPENYGIKREIPRQDLEKYMKEICVQNINELAEYGMIWTDEDGFLVKPLEPGRLMTKFYLKFATMKSIMEAPGSCSLEDALRIICASEEISWIQLRRNEKKILNDINFDKEDRMRFHVYGEKGKKKKRIQTREEKIFVLTNDCLTGDPSVRDLSLSQDMNSICTNGCRIAKCMKECFIFRRSYKGALNSSLLSKCLHQRLWEDSPYLLKQLPGIGMVTAKALHSAGINSFDTMFEADPRRIELITGRKYPFGNHIKESLLSLPPKIELHIEETEYKRQCKSRLLIKLTRLSRPITSSKHHYADLFVGSEEDNAILFHEKIRAEEFSSPYVANVLVPCPQYGRVTVKADLIFENYVGLDVHAKLVISLEVSSNITQARRNENRPSNYTIPKETNIKNDNNVRNLLDKSEENKDLEDSERAPTSLPSFDLLQDEMNEAILEPGEMDGKPKKDETIFDHIRRKSKSFPDLITLKTMDLSHKPSILTGVNNSVDQSELDSSKTQEDCVILIDSEPLETINTSMDQCDFHTAKAQADVVILIDNDPVNNLTESNDAAKYTQNSDVHILDRNERFINSSSIIIDQPDKKQSFNLIENSTDSEISSDVSYHPNNQLNERKRFHNWINDVIVKDCKKHKSGPSSDSCSTRSCDVPSSRIKPEGSELCDVFVPSSSLGTPSGSMGVSFLGFKSVFSFL